MKRDWDYIRDLLLAIESEEDVYLRQDGEEKNIFIYHLQLLTEQGYIIGPSVGTYMNGSKYVNPVEPRLSMEGHDLLDTLRSQGLWERIKAGSKERGIELTFESIKIAAAHFLPKMF